MFDSRILRGRYLAVEGKKIVVSSARYILSICCQLAMFSIFHFINVKGSCKRWVVVYEGVYGSLSCCGGVGKGGIM